MQLADTKNKKFNRPASLICQICNMNIFSYSIIVFIQLLSGSVMLSDKTRKQNDLRMKNRLFLAVVFALALPLWAANNQILGWNNLGMHCMDSDYSVFSILPPYNTIESQLIVGGKLVTNGSVYTVTYQAVADPSGSFNSTAMGKGNYYTYAQSLFGAVLAPEGGLVGWNMPGVSNTPQAMLFEQTNQPAAGVLTPVN